MITNVTALEKILKKEKSKNVDATSSDRSFVNKTLKDCLRLLSCFTFFQAVKIEGNEQKSSMRKKLAKRK